MKFLKEKFSIVLFLSVSINLAFAQDENSKVKHALDVMYALGIVSGTSDFSFIERGTFEKDSLGKIIGQRIGYVSFGYKNVINDNSIPAYRVKLDYNQSYTGLKLSDDCKESGIDLIWKNNRIISASDYRDYDIKYDNMGRIWQMWENRWVRFNDHWVRKRFTFSYKNNHIYEIAQAEEIGKGKSFTEVKLLFSKPEYMKRIEYKGDTLDVSVRKYIPKKSAGDPTKIETGGRILVVKDSSQVTVTKKQDGAVVGNSEMKFLKPGVRQFTLVQGKYKTVETYELNKLGAVVHMIQKQYVNDELSSHTESFYEYRLETPKSSPRHCDYLVDATKQNFDLKGNVVAEFNKEGLKRTKLEDGTWGPWKQLTY